MIIIIETCVYVRETVVGTRSTDKRAKSQIKQANARV